jgi:hypothetical protein
MITRPFGPPRLVVRSDANTRAELIRTIDRELERVADKPQPDVLQDVEIGFLSVATALDHGYARWSGVSLWADG